MPTRTPASPTYLLVGGVPVRLQRSRQRRTLALRVGPDGAVLYAPASVPQVTLLSFLNQKAEWLRRHSETFAARQQPAPDWRSGMSLPYLGAALTLRHQPGLRRAERRGDELYTDPRHAEAQTEAWYRQAALSHFGPLVGALAARLGRPVARVRLTSARTRWGSCTASGEIRLHWRLLLAPPEVADYVAAHEVAHLAQLDHSPRYWATLARLRPDYARPQAWLRDHGWQLAGWQVGREQRPGRASSDPA